MQVRSIGKLKAILKRLKEMRMKKKL